MLAVHFIYGTIIVVLILIIIFIVARTKVKLEVICGSSPRKCDIRKYDEQTLIAPKTAEQYREELRSAIEIVHASEEFGKKSKLSEACYDAVIGGKRIRSIVLLEIARAVNCNEAHKPIDTIELALAIEYVHAASLVLDDLPEFDNDMTRRNAPTIHVKYGPAVAQLAALTLMSAAFQNVCRQIDWLRTNSHIKNPDYIGTIIYNNISQSLGAEGAAGGQYMDTVGASVGTVNTGANSGNSVASGDTVANSGNIIELMGKKTARLFEMAVVAGWISTGGNQNDLPGVKQIGTNLGIAFQIADDIGDYEKDKAANRPNYAIIHGKDNAKKDMEQKLKITGILLKKYNLNTPIWEAEIFKMVRDMT
jgi:geranylgeranyl pyrophosphate synthase